MLVIARIVAVLLVATGIQAFHHPSYLRESTVNVYSLKCSLAPKQYATESMQLQAKSSSNDSDRKKKGKGVYVRPSAAIERGSGFFVPGLEGSRVRILFGSIVLISNFFSMSGFTDVESMSALGISERISIFFAVLLLIQGSVEYAKETDNFGGMSEGKLSQTVKNDDTDLVSNDDVDADKYLEQAISPSLNESYGAVTEAISWVAASYVALTPATHVMLLESIDDKNSSTILYSLGNFASGEQKSSQDVCEDINTAMKTVHESKGGRVSIPSTHPSSVALLPEENRRCVLLQKVQVPQSDELVETKRKLCLFIGSDQLLQAFTKNDLKWLGSLGKYLSLNI